MQWRGEAYNAWKADIDGIHLTNRFDTEELLLHELGDPSILAKLPRIDQTLYYNEDSTFKPQGWVPDGLKYLKKPRDQKAAPKVRQP